ncbi:MAG: small subunit ribosomal protein S17 [Candidatus Omnitrophota bacterium]|jgi:small subunit ribosomal protein S17
MTNNTDATQRINKRKTIKGTVKSAKMNKTIVVEASYKIKHSEYNKVVVKHTKIKAHDEENKAKAGDTVAIRESRPFSKEKRWVLTEVLAVAGDSK